MLAQQLRRRRAAALILHLRAAALAADVPRLRHERRA
jgi:hypothetical protein